MSVVEPMLRSHPNHRKMAQIGSRPDALAAIVECGIACQSCSDACIAEADPGPFLRSIRMNADCAAICAATASVPARANDPDWRVIQAQISACIAACTACAEECERHPRQRSCRICAAACRYCVRICEHVRAEIRAPRPMGAQ